MTIEVSQERTPNLREYEQIRMSLEVRQIFDVTVLDNGLGGFRLAERTLATPYLKDYDAIESPAQWSFDISKWAFFMARDQEVRVGGAAVAFDTAGLDMLEGRSDLAVLWDIRVAAEARRNGVGSALFRAVENWASAKGCRQLKVETQNINVPACRFYAKQGCVLGSIHRFAYPDFPNEAQLLWYKDLNTQSGSK